MIKRRATTLDWLARLKAEWVLALFGSLAIALALADPQPLANYQRWLQLPTLAALAGLLLAIQGIRESGVVQHAAAALAARMRSVRPLGLLLVTATALLSTVLTNDVSLFLMVPLTLALGGMSNLPVMRVVILEALAVNAGSALSPIGNPQNLLLWQHSQMPMLTFVIQMLPAVAVMFGLVLMLTWCWLPRQPLGLQQTGAKDERVSRRLAVMSALGLLLMVVLMQAGHAVIGTALLMAAFLLSRRQVLAELDWLLLLTFAAIFLALGHFTHLPLVQHALEQLDLQQALPLYLAGIIASQLISNVPATVLLLDHSHDAIALAVAVNVGGFGTVIGSMANLIALRLAKQPHGMLRLQKVSIPFLLVCTPLVYLIWHGLG